MVGYFTAEGVEVELVDSPSPGAATAGLADGRLDVSWGGPMRVMKARNDPAEVALVAFCEVVRRDPFYLVGRADLAPFALSRLTDVRFASVSEVPTPWLCLQHDLREAGIDPDTIDRVSHRTMADNLAALAAGEVDVVQMFEPFVAEALRKGAGTILHAASGRGETSYTTFLATPASLARNRDAFTAMTRAVGRTQAWLADHDGAELAKVVAGYYPGVAQSLLGEGLERYRLAGLWAGDTRLSPAGFDRLAVSLQSGGFISKIPAYDDCVANLA